MSTPIYLNNNSTDDLTKTLLAIAVSRQQNDIQKEQVKIRQQELKVQQEERQAKQQAEQETAMQKQAEQAMMLQQLLGPARQMIGQAFGAAQTGLPGQMTGAPPMPQMSPVQQQFTQFAGQNPKLAAPAAATAMKMFEVEKKKREAAQAVDEMITLAGPMWTEQQRNQVRALGRGANGEPLPKELLVSLIPPDAKTALEIGEAQRKAGEAKSMAEADKISTEALVRMGRLAPGTGPVVGATKMLADEKNAIAKDARSADLEMKKIAAENMEKVLESRALEVALDVGPDPKAIASALSTRYPKLAAGMATKAAVAAAKGIGELNKAKAPTEAQGKYRLVYAPARAAEANVMEAVKAGAKWGGIHDEAVAEYKFPVAGDVPIMGDLLRLAARKRMSPEQQKLFVAAILLTDARVRPISGATVTAGEVRNTVNAFIPQTSDATPENSAQKLAALRDHMETLRETAGIDKDTPGTSAAEMLLEMQRGETTVKPAPNRESDIRAYMNQTGASYNEAARMVDARKRQSVPRSQ